MTQPLVFILVALPSLAFGIFLMRRPTDAFAMQKKFYRLINWNIEPVSLAKEIRNTRMMGLFLILFVIGCGVVLWWP